MAASAPHTIILRGRPARREAAAGGAITPGMLLKTNSSGAYIAHNVAAGGGPLIVAAENEVVGGDISDAYASLDRVLAWHLQSGDEAYMLLPANAPAIVIGDYLESNGDGTLRKVLGLTGTLTGTNNGALTDITFNATWSSGQANEINSNFEEIQEDLNIAPPSALFVAKEAVDNSANGSIVRIKVVAL